MAHEMLSFQRSHDRGIIHLRRDYIMYIAQVVPSDDDEQPMTEILLENGHSFFVAGHHAIILQQYEETFA